MSHVHLKDLLCSAQKAFEVLLGYIKLIIKPNCAGRLSWVKNGRTQLLGYNFSYAGLFNPLLGQI